MTGQEIPQYNRGFTAMPVQWDCGYGCSDTATAAAVKLRLLFQ